MKKLSNPKGIIIHHSATRDTDSISFDAIRRFHVGEKGWDDIGYHYLIETVDGAPEIFTGRGVQYHGAHCVGKNDSLGICVVGDYDDRDAEPMRDGKIERLVGLIAGLLLTYPHLTCSDIHFHNEYANKSCPGVYFPKLSTIKRYVLQKVAPLNFTM